MLGTTVPPPIWGQKNGRYAAGAAANWLKRNAVPVFGTLANIKSPQAWNEEK
ncbi:hypothetical protein Ngar_c08100 [Candidatus Nitrososphaera gargensis Ga9.2]|uniref:Uncharacterized protein n=1 Tax=Nitrososphaera gargensis (strain Ga9.2) TaxID=1237085 RepID=K0IIB1_NITGG|nr:hypothetical protein Ngar_c08100 [Candidatus Nitrososphaera gargensis Ga9.2]